MEERKHVPIEQMDFFLRFVAVANWAWEVVEAWKPLARETIGKQLVRACDSVGANLVEGDGRYSDADALHFFIVARASAREARYWIERAQDRGLLSAELAQQQIAEIVSATRLLNCLITYRRGQKMGSRVREARALYQIDVSDEDPFASDSLAPLTPNASTPNAQALP